MSPLYGGNMQKDTLKVGTQKGDFYVNVEISIPDTDKDVLSLSKNSEAYRVAKFTRGYRIDLQEGGARQIVAEMLAGQKQPAAVLMKDDKFMATVKAAVQKEIAAFDPLAPRARKTRAPVVNLSLEDGKQYSAEEVKAMLAAVRGLNVEVK